MSVITRFDVVNKLIELRGFKSYLEIGYQWGVSFDAVRCAYKKAVDPTPMKIVPELYLGTSDNFFRFNTEKFDIVFIDGLHVYEQVKRDFENSIQVLNPGGLICFHDMNPPSEEWAKSFLEGGQWNGDCYKLAIDLWAGNYKYDYYTIADEYGCMVVNPFKEVSRIKLPQHMYDYTYKLFDQYRAQILNFQTEVTA